MNDQPVLTPWIPQKGPQEWAIDSAGVIDEVLFGGARFGGKTAFTLADFVQDISQGPQWRGILFRKTVPELDDVIHQSLQMYPRYGGEYKVGKNEWHFPTGSVLSLRHMEDEKDYTRYHGHSYSAVYFDDLGEWTDMAPYKAMISTLRGPAQRKRIRCSANPGGRGHLAIKEHFRIGEYPKGMHPFVHKPSGMTRMYIPSRASDNAIGLRDDPDYVKRLNAVGDESLVKAWVEGDWDAIVGNYFSMWNSQKHVVDPFKIPATWPIYMGLDYGESNPTAALFAAVSHDEEIFIFGEYAQGNRGAAEHARGVKDALTQNPYAQKRMPQMAFADPSMWTRRRTDEASLARSPYDTFVKNKVFLNKANNERVNGWRMVMDGLRHGRLFFFRGETKNIVAAMPTMQRDPSNPEDLIKGGNDHPVDALRYLMSHVYKTQEPDELPDGDFTGAKILDLLNVAFEK